MSPVSVGPSSPECARPGAVRDHGVRRRRTSLTRSVLRRGAGPEASPDCAEGEASNVSPSTSRSVVGDRQGFVRGLGLGHRIAGDVR